MLAFAEMLKRFEQSKPLLDYLDAEEDAGRLEPRDRKKVLALWYQNRRLIDLRAKGQALGVRFDLRDGADGQQCARVWLAVFPAAKLDWYITTGTLCTLAGRGGVYTRDLKSVRTALEAFAKEGTTPLQRKRAAQSPYAPEVGT